jgi:large subunit ribosomal protein L25
MMEKITLKSEPRELFGRKVLRLRKMGIIPANVYGRNVKSQSLQIVLKDFQTVFAKAGETGLVELDLEKEKLPVLVHDIQYEPVSHDILHIDFLQVDLKQKVTAQVPVEFVGESPAEKQGLGTVVQYIDEIEVEALPAELPDKFEVDISVLSEVGQAIYIKDIKHDSKVEVKENSDEIVAKVEPPKEEKEEVKPVSVEAEAVAAEGESSTTEEKKESTDKVDKTN